MHDITFHPKLNGKTTAVSFLRKPIRRFFRILYSKILNKMLTQESKTILALILGSTLFLANAQDGSIQDPFPGNHGPEEPRPTPAPYTGCPAECDRRLTDANAAIALLQQQIQTLNITVISRLNNVPTGGSGNSNELTNRVINTENYLYGNITSLTNKLANDIAVTRLDLTESISKTRTELNDRIIGVQAMIPTGGSGGGGSGEAVYKNITTRLDGLEYNKVQTLIDENNLWRKNFDVINKTFSKMRKSKYSNDVVVVG